MSPAVPSTYDWYRRYRQAGTEGLADRASQRQQFWNCIPESIREQVVEIALEKTDLSPRQLAWHLTDTQSYFISESSVYRILKAYDLVTSPVFQLVSAKDRFDHPTTRVNELWQTDFTQFKVVDWGYYYLSTVLDDYSRYILAWRLATSMGSTDVEKTLQLAVGITPIE
jgi:putative transposase